MVRQKRRYLVIQVHLEEGEISKLQSISEKNIYHAISLSIKDLYGDYGVGVYGMSINTKYWNPYTGILFLKCPRDFHKEVRSSISFVKNISNHICMLNCLYITATLKSAETYLHDFNTKKMNVTLNKCKTPQERTCVMEQMKQFNVKIFRKDETMDIEE